MIDFSFVDIFSTKGPEYLFVIGYLVVLVGFWRYWKYLKDHSHAEE